MMMNLQTVRTWSQTTVSQTSLLTALQQAFDHVDIFAEIYIPVKQATSLGQPKEYHYENIGLMPDEIASIYAEMYGSNYLVEDFDNPSVAANKLANRIQAVIHLNKSKYLKYIETQGYSWNPLWNVDGTVEEERFNHIVNNFNETYSKGTTLTISPTTVATTNYNNFKVEDETTHMGQAYTYNDSTTENLNMAEGNPSTGEEASRQYLPLDRTITDLSQTTDTVSKTYTGNTDVTMSGSDTHSWSGDDGKTGGNSTKDNGKTTTTRQGNIGVTKTTELIDSARETLKWSILMDFFDDINKQILVGIY